MRMSLNMGGFCAPVAKMHRARDVKSGWPANMPISDMWLLSTKIKVPTKKSWPNEVIWRMWLFMNDSARIYRTAKAEIQSQIMQCKTGLPYQGNNKADFVASSCLGYRSHLLTMFQELHRCEWHSGRRWLHILWVITTPDSTAFYATTRSYRVRPIDLSHVRALG